MKKSLLMGIMGGMFLVGCNQAEKPEAEAFDYTLEQFADLQILRYKVHGFEDLSLKQKELVYYLQEKESEVPSDAIRLPSFEEISKNTPESKEKFARSYKIQEENTDAINGKAKTT